MEDHRFADTFDPKTERIEDYKERFDFYCVAHGVEEAKQKALFLTRIGQTAYSKLKTLVSPTLLVELDLNTIVEKLAEHYRPDTVEIAERFKFFKRQQNDEEGVTEYMAELRKLAKHATLAVIWTRHRAINSCAA